MTNGYDRAQNLTEVDNFIFHINISNKKAGDESSLEKV